MPQTDGEWRIISAIPPLLKTKWGQGSAYKPNSYGRFCPNKVAGCVIVAAAQIIAYYQAESTFHPKGEHRGHYNQPIHLDWERIMADCQNNLFRLSVLQLYGQLVRQGAKIQNEVLTRGQSYNYRYDFQHSIISKCNDC